MTQPTNSRLAFILGADAATRDLLTRYRAATSDASRRVGADTRLTTEGKAQALRDARGRITAEYGAELATLGDQAANAVTALRATANSQLPKPATGIEGILSRQAQWARARTLFEAGYRTQDVIARASDFEFLHSLREELPIAIAAGIATGYGNVDTLNSLIDRRLAELTSPAAVAALDNADAAEIAYAGVAPLIQYAEAEITGQATERTGLTAAVASAQARQLATLRLRPIEQDMNESGSGA